MSKGQATLGVALTVGFIALTAFYFFGPSEIKPVLKEPLMLVTGCWIANFTTVVNWFFGSSKGSSDKNALLKKQP